MRHHDQQVNIRIGVGLAIGIRPEQNDPFGTEPLGYLADEGDDVIRPDHSPILPRSPPLASAA